MPLCQVEGSPCAVHEPIESLNYGLRERIKEPGRKCWEYPRFGQNEGHPHAVLPVGTESGRTMMQMGYTIEPDKILAS